MNNKQQSLAPHLTWLVPLVSAIISGIIMGIIEIYDMSGRLDQVEHIKMTTSAEYIKKIDNMEWQLKHIEDFCCSEIKEYDYYLEKRAEHGLESDTKH
jgi:hypothetical protein